MNPLLLNIEIQNFILDNLYSDITSLILKGTSFKGVDTLELIEQIESKKRSRQKLPTWFHQDTIYYPNKLNIEQTSSELTALYKTSLLNGSSLIDLTGGFGVDSYYFSKHFSTVTHCEIDKSLSEIVSHNFQQLGVENVETIAEDGLVILNRSQRKYDWIYVDPSRRHDDKGKVFFLKDCSPNIPKVLGQLFEYSKNLMIKTSPLLDITAGLEELTYVKSIHVVAVDNDVKELLWILEKDYLSSVIIHTINIKSTIKEVFNFQLSAESQIELDYSLPLTYLYEPNAAILKSGGFNSVSAQFNASKLHKHSHLYTADELIDFPGRRFQINQSLSYSKKAIKQLIIQKANITTRNFPETVQQIRKSFKIKDGGTIYMFFTTNLMNEKIVLICSKVE